MCNGHNDDMQRTSYKRTGARRAGDDYQDLVALELMLDWLEDPDAYSYIEVEADDLGAMDDVVALKSDGTLCSRQVKFSTAPNKPEDQLNWDKLLEQPSGKKGLKDSLLKKWATGVSKVRGKSDRFDTRVITNRLPSPDLSSALGPHDGKLAIDKLAPDVMARITAQLGNDNIQELLAALTFEFNRPDHETYEERLRRRFNGLGGTQMGWLQLKDEFRSWVGKRNVPASDGRILLRHIKRAAGWRDLQSLPQDFVIPADYVLPSDQFHATTMKLLSAHDTHCTVIEAPPGYGKSTYASFVYAELMKLSAPVVRHHYFLSLNDRAGRDRLEAQSAAESIAADIRSQFPTEIGAANAVRPDSQSLGQLIESAAAQFAQNPRPLVVILDGLDHVWRETRSTEQLSQLLRHLLPVPDGVVVMLVTQPIPDGNMPSEIRKHIPDRNWRNLPALDEEHVSQWITAHQSHLAPPHANEGWAEIASHELFEKTSGHPLLLQYAFRAIEEQGADLSAAAISELPGCPHGDVNAYYADLLATLSTAAKGTLHLMATCRFPWPRRAIRQCLSKTGLSEAEALDAIDALAPLLSSGDLGLSSFHASLLVHIEGTSEYEDVSQEWRRRALHWIQNEAPEYWRWANDWTLQADDGDVDPLCNGLTRDWVVKAIADGMPADETERILARGVAASLNEKRFGDAIRIGILRDYLQRGHDMGSEVLEHLLPSQLAYPSDDYLVHRLMTKLGSLSPVELVILAKSCAKSSDHSNVRRILDHLQNRKTPKTLKEYGLQLSCVSQVAGLLKQPPVEAAVQHAIQERRNNLSEEVVRSFAKSLREQGDVRTMRAFLDGAAELTVGEWHAAMREAIKLALVQNVALDQYILDERSIALPECAVFARSRGPLPSEFRSVTFTISGHTELEDDRTFLTGSDSRPVSDVVRDIFYGFWANHLSSNAVANSNWIDGLKHEWHRRFFQMMNDGCQALAARTSESDDLTLSDLLVMFSAFRQTDEPDRADFQLVGFARKAGGSILSLLVELAIRKAEPSQRHATGADITMLLDSQLCSSALLVNHVSRSGLQLPTDAASALIGAERLRSSIESQSFRERAEDLATLAEFASSHEVSDEAKGLVQQAASNFLAHGYHKDVLLFAPLEAAEVCHKAGIGDVAEWIKITASAVAKVDSFTDGDETRHLPVRLAQLLAVVCPGSLVNYYRWLCAEQEWYDAERVLRTIISSVDLTELPAQLLTATAVGEADLKFLVTLAEEATPGAEDVLRQQKSLYGADVTQFHEESATSLDSESEKPAPEAKNYKVDQFATFYSDLPWGDRDQYVEGWLDYWANQGTRDVAFDEVATVARRNTWWSGAEGVYRFCLRRYGKAEAFEWLVKAQRENHGWTDFWSDKAGSEQRCNEVLRSYRERWHEFLVESLSGKSSYGFEAASFTNQELVRVCSFLVAAGQSDLATDMVQSAVQISRELVPLDCAVPDWIAQSPSDHLALDVLIERLGWPSGLSRERAAAGLAILLGDTKYNQDTQDRLLASTKRQRLESMCALRLLPFAMAETTELPPIEVVLAAIQAPSIVSWLLLKETFAGFDRTLASCLGASASMPATHTKNPRFDEFSTQVLPPIYRTRAAEIEQRFLYPFCRWWEYEWSLLAAPEHLTLPTYPRYWYRSSDDHVAAFDVPMSEVYRSAYLRTLSRAFTTGVLTEQSVRALGAATFSVDLGLVRVLPQPKPMDWPTSKYTGSNTVDTTSETVWRAVEVWWEDQEGREAILCHANGRVVDGEVPYDLEIWGVLQKSVGPVEPAAKSVAEALDEMPSVSCGIGTLRLEGELAAVELGPSRFADWEILPICVPIVPGTVPRYQWWRMQRGLYAPCAPVASGVVSCSCASSGIEYLCAGEHVASWRDWTKCVRERARDERPSMSGVELRVDRQRIEEAERRLNMKFCWVCRVICYYGARHERSKPPIVQCRIFGAKHIIT